MAPLRHLIHENVLNFVTRSVHMILWVRHSILSMFRYGYLSYSGFQNVIDIHVYGLLHCIDIKIAFVKVSFTIRRGAHDHNEVLVEYAFTFFKISSLTDLWEFDPDSVGFCLYVNS